MPNIQSEQSNSSYEKKYQSGYGLQYPDGQVIRLYEKFLKYEYGFTSGKMLDIGCGIGQHLSYFKSKGFETYGFEFASTAVSQAKLNFPDVASNIKVGDFTKKIDYFDGLKFDFIFSNQVLYYADRNQLEIAINEIDKVLNPGGLVYFTMIGTKSYYYDNSFPLPNSDLRRVTLKGRLNEVTDILFIDNEQQLVDTFNLFDPLFVGHYDISMREGSGFHYQYLGRKRNK